MQMKMIQERVGGDDKGITEGSEMTPGAGIEGWNPGYKQSG